MAAWEVGGTGEEGKSDVIQMERIGKVPFCSELMRIQKHHES